MLSIQVCYVLITTKCTFLKQLWFWELTKLLLQHGSSFWLWRHVFIGKWRGRTKSSSKCSHLWAFLCTCSRWTFPGEHEGKTNVSLMQCLYILYIWSIGTMSARFPCWQHKTVNECWLISSTYKFMGLILVRLLIYLVYKILYMTFWLCPGEVCLAPRSLFCVYVDVDLWSGVPFNF